MHRLLCAVSIVNALPAHTKIILFCERIKAAEQLYIDLLKHYPDKTGLYHSEMADNARQDILQRYMNGEIRLLVCCKALDEGLNIPSTDAGIIVSSTRSARQRIQRMGRILRHSTDIKRIYCLYIGQSSEANEFLTGLSSFSNSVPVISLRYHNNAFIHTEYENLRTIVCKYVSSRRRDPEMLNALNRNIDLALLRGDFLLTESVCREKRKASLTIIQRNYWTSVLYILHARKGKL